MKTYFLMDTDILLHNLLSYFRLKMSATSADDSAILLETVVTHLEEATVSIQTILLSWSIWKCYLPLLLMHFDRKCWCKLAEILWFISCLCFCFYYVFFFFNITLRIQIPLTV